MIAVTKAMEKVTVNPINPIKLAKLTEPTPERNLFLFMMDDCNGTMYLYGLFDSLDPITNFEVPKKEYGHYFVIKVALGELRPCAPLWNLDDKEFVFGADDWSYYNTKQFKKWQRGEEGPDEEGSDEEGSGEEGSDSEN